MKVISLGLDNLILNKSSALANRIIEYGGLVEKYTVIVPSPKDEKIELSEKVKACGSGGSNKLVQFIKIYNAAKKLLQEEKYDIITVQDQYYLALIGICLAKKYRIGLEIQVHGFEKYYRLRKLIAKHVLPHANAVRVVSHRLKKQLAEDFKVAENKITVVSIYSEANDLKQKEVNRKDRDSNKFIFLTVGRLVPVKNISLQIEAMAEITKKYPQAELWIVGDGSEREKLKLEIRNWRLEINTKLFGWQKDILPYYAQADVFLLTSNYEGWSLAVIEAASYGLPIIMTDVGCAGEVIKDRENGLVIKVGDLAALERAMLELISDGDLRKRLGEGAKAALAKLPSKEEIFKLYKISWEKALL